MKIKIFRLLGSFLLLLVFSLSSKAERNTKIYMGLGGSHMYFTSGSSLTVQSGASLILPADSIGVDDISAGSLDNDVIVSSVSVGAIYPASLQVGTYSNIIGVGTLSSLSVTLGNLVANMDWSVVESSTEIIPTSSFLVINGTGTITLSSTPNISTDTFSNGDYLILMGGSNAVIFQDNDTLSGSLLELGDTSRSLGDGDIIGLILYNSKWYELFYNNN